MLVGVLSVCVDGLVVSVGELLVNSVVSTVVMVLSFVSSVDDCVPDSVVASDVVVEVKPSLTSVVATELVTSASVVYEESVL